jgi:hypothetical protein
LKPLKSLSAQGRAVLEWLVSEKGPLPIAPVLPHVRRPGVSLSVARAKLSRTLRRLWVAGLVEIADKQGTTLTGHVAPIQRWAQ